MHLREQEIISGREEEIRERNIRKEQEMRDKFNVTMRTPTDVGGFSDNDTASMSEHTSQEPIQPVPDFRSCDQENRLAITDEQI